MIPHPHTNKQEHTHQRPIESRCVGGEKLLQKVIVGWKRPARKASSPYGWKGQVRGNEKW
jgi:hypothetical protein